MDKAADIERRFSFHAGNEKTIPQHEEVRGACKDLAHLLSFLLPEGREKSLAITKLEEAMFWSNAAIARDGK